MYLVILYNEKAAVSKAKKAMNNYYIEGSILKTKASFDFSLILTSTILGYGKYR